MTVAAVAVFLLVPYVNLRLDGQPATRPQLPRSLTPKFWRPLLDHSGPEDDEAQCRTLDPADEIVKTAIERMVDSAANAPALVGNCATEFERQKRIDLPSGST